MQLEFLQGGTDRRACVQLTLQFLLCFRVNRILRNTNLLQRQILQVRGAIASYNWQNWIYMNYGIKKSLTLILIRPYYAPFLDDSKINIRGFLEISWNSNLEKLVLKKFKFSIRITISICQFSFF